MCKNRLTSLKLCTSSFLFGFQADIWPFNEFYGNQFALSNGKDYRDLWKEQLTGCNKTHFFMAI